MASRPLRILGYILAGLIGLVLVTAAATYGASTVKLRRTYPRPSHPPFSAGPSDSAKVARGRHLAEAIGKCADCHGADLGGTLFIDGGAAFGQVYSANLTRGRGGVGGQRSDGDLELAIRHGVRPDGRGLRIMPADQLNRMSDEDLASLIAYLRQVPPVDRTLPSTHLGPIARGLFATGQFPLVPAAAIDQGATHAPAPPVGPTAEYGKYLAAIGGCHACHGPGLSGGHVPGTPPEFKPAANITPEGIGRYTEADFTRILREGKRPDGTSIDPFMPWKATREMTDGEIAAVYAYLKTVPARAYGTR